LYSFPKRTSINARKESLDSEITCPKKVVKVLLRFSFVNFLLEDEIDSKRGREGSVGGGLAVEVSPND
jgi:hypothetical protein